MSKHKCPGSSTLTEDGAACEIKLDIPLFCGLTKDSVPGWPRCYKKDGSSLAIPPTPVDTTTIGGTGTGIAKKQLEPNCTDILNVQYANLIDSINEIHQFEQDLFDKLETVENGGTSDMNATELRGRISDLSKLRNQLYTDLNNILTSTQCNLADSRQNLADQVTMVEIVKKELDNSEKAIAELQDIRNNRRRMVEITTYEKNRYSAHKDIFKIIAFCGLGILFSIFLINRGFTTIGNSGIVLSITLAVILTLRNIYNIWWRDNMNWNRYNFGRYGGATGGGGSSQQDGSVWKHDVAAVEKIYYGGEQEFDTLKTSTEKETTKIYGAAQTVAGKAKGDVNKAVSTASVVTHKTDKKNN